MIPFNGRSDFNMPMGGACEPKECECHICGGSGELPFVVSIEPLEVSPLPERCPVCSGTGIISKSEQD